MMIMNGERKRGVHNITEDLYTTHQTQNMQTSEASERASGKGPGQELVVTLQRKRDTKLWKKIGAIAYRHAHGVEFEPCRQIIKGSG